MEKAKHPLFFDSFDKTSKKEWQDKVNTDRKGAPLDDLFWSIEKDIQLAPFYHADDIKQATSPILGSKNQVLSIGESIEVKDILTANKQALKALSGGVNAPEFIISQLLNVAGFEKLFQNIDLSFISTHFKIVGNDCSIVSFFEHFASFVKTTTASSIEGSLNFDHSTCSDADIKSILNRCTNQLDNFHIFNLEVQESDAISTELSTLIFTANTIIEKYKKEGYAADLIAKHIQFSLCIGKDYFVAIAKIRALKLLWANVLKAHGCDCHLLPAINIRFAPSTFGEDENKNMISAATMTLSAIIGGANAVFVGKIDKNTTNFSRRIARNVQHILQMESYIDKVADPAAGSYFIETSTAKIAEKSWAKFQLMT